MKRYTYKSLRFTIISLLLRSCFVGVVCLAISRSISGSWNVFIALAFSALISSFRRATTSAATWDEFVAANRRRSRRVLSSKVAMIFRYSSEDLEWIAAASPFVFARCRFTDKFDIAVRPARYAQSCRCPQLNFARIAAASLALLVPSHPLFIAYC